MLGQAWFIASRDLAYMLRQRETLVWVFLMPFLFFYFIGTVTGGGGGLGPSVDKPVGIAIDGPQSGGFMLDELYVALRDEGFELVFPEADLELYKRRLEFPEDFGEHANFTESVLAGQQVPLRFVRDGGGSAADLDKLRLYRAVYGVLADLVVLESNGVEVTAESLRQFHDKPHALTLSVEAAGKRLEIPSGYSQTIPGTMVMFTMMILLTSGAILLVSEREKGLLRRLASTPIPRSAVVLGKWLGKMALAVVQIAFAMLAGVLVFGMDWGPSLPMVGLLMFSWAAFCASLAIVLAGIARSEAQMSGLGVLSTMVLAALGGCWWPIEVTSDWMQSLARWLPTGWTMDAMHQLVNFGNPASSAVGSVLALLSGAVVLGWFGARSFRYQ
jgi:ABC-type transport system involved in multi-copper enzyme maturation permease subunit